MGFLIGFVSQTIGQMILLSYLDKRRPDRDNFMSAALGAFFFFTIPAAFIWAFVRSL